MDDNERVLDDIIDANKRATAKGAIVGIRMVAPVTKRTYAKTERTREEKDARAAYMREYRARLPKEKKDAYQQRANDRRRAIRKGQSYVYLPSIPQARDRRRKGDLLAQYYANITARLKIDDINLKTIAHSRAEREIDLALQIARRPSGHKWHHEIMPPRTQYPTLLYYDAPTPANHNEYIPPLDIQPYRDGSMTKDYSRLTMWIEFAKHIVSTMLH